MKVILCGAGQVASSIARQLVAENNQVVVIDESADAIQKLTERLQVKAIIGMPSYPSVLEEARAAQADMIIAVTSSDELNMLICQVAYSLFNVPNRIARIRNQHYLNPIWNQLYSQNHLPIDHIISPENEVAKAILNRLHVPGAMDMIPFADGLLKVIEVRCSGTSGLMGMSLSQVREILLELGVSILGMMREDRFIPVQDHVSLRAEDALFFVTDNANVQAAMRMFGHEEREARRAIILGGGNIGLSLCQYMEEEENISVKLIELNMARAEYVAGQLSKTIVIQGDALDQEILSEVNVSAAETIIAVTNDDEINIFASMIAKREGCQRTIAIVNKSASYASLIGTLGIDVIVNPREVTVSTILQHIRRGKVRAAYSICNSTAELIELEIVAHASVIGQTISDLDLPEGVMIGAIARAQKLLIPVESDTLQEKDRVLIISPTSEVKKIDDIFSSRQDYF